MKIKSKQEDNVRLYYELGEKVEIGDLLEISEDERSVVIQVMDIEQDMELLLSGEKGLEILAKIRLEGFGSDFRTYREWSGWFPSSPMLIKRINASDVLSPEITKERLFIGYERGKDAPFYISPIYLKTLNVIAGLNSEQLLAFLTPILYLKNNRVLVIDLTGKFHRILKTTLRKIKTQFSYLQLGENFKIPYRNHFTESLIEFLKLFDLNSLTINIVNNILQETPYNELVGLEKLVKKVLARRDMEFLIDLIQPLENIMARYSEDFQLEDFTILDVSKCSIASALFVILYYLLDPKRYILAINGIQKLAIQKSDKLASLILSKKKPVFVNIDVDSEASVFLRYAVNMFFTGPYNRVLNDILPLVENEEPLIQKLSAEEFLVNGLLTKNTPVILSIPRITDVLSIREE